MNRHYERKPSLLSMSNFSPCRTALYGIRGLQHVAHAVPWIWCFAFLGGFMQRWHKSQLESVSYMAGNTMKARETSRCSHSQKQCVTWKRLKLCIMFYDATLSLVQLCRKLRLVHLLGRCQRSEPIYHWTSRVTHFCDKHPQRLLMLATKT